MTSDSAEADPGIEMGNVAALKFPRVPVARGSFNAYSPWLPRVWSGMRAREWARILLQARFRVDVWQLPWVGLTTLLAPGNSLLAWAQQLAFGRAIKGTTIDRHPVFILGHWRCGTTLLHELLALDDRLAAPTNYQVFAVNHFLITEPLALRYLRFLVPKKRPMDNVALEWESPQEDEYLWLVGCQPTPYMRIVRPDDWEGNLRYLDMRDVSAEELARWKQTFLRFLKCVTLKTDKQLLLKSPPHTARIHILREMFPQAKFIHITRHPYVMIPSTIRLWHALDETQALRRGAHAYTEHFVLEVAERMYASFHRHRPTLPESTICELRYEDFIERPLDTLESVYRQLDLGDFAAVRQRAEAFLQRRADYQTNQYELPEYWRRRIHRSLHEYMERYGYSATAAPLKKAA
jgi:hypothetical protein